MRPLLARIVAPFRGRVRKKVIAVFGVTRAEVACAARHAQTSAESLPVWAFCSEVPPPDGELVPGCAREVSGAGALKFRVALRGVWPALSIVAWTGHAGPVALKLGPFFLPPFRVLVLNEAGDFFPGTPAEIARHAMRRLRDAFVREADSIALRTRSLAWRAGERIRDLLGLAWSFLWRTGERTRDVVVLAWSFLFRTGERIRDLLGLVWSFLWRSGQRIRDVLGLARSFLWHAGERVADAFNWLWEAFLALLAHSAGWTSPLAHSTVKGLRRPDASGPKMSWDSFVEVAIPTRGWPRRRVLRALTRSSAEWVVLRWRDERAGQDEIRALIGMARETNAFAVAKQTAHSAWRKPVVTRHPFRRLQNGEVSEVFAPFSSLLVLRRRTASRLGLPRALTYGGALAILFWKASAAGFASFAVGHDAAVTDEPAMALEDAELSLRLMCSPSLAALGSLRPSRFRGNVAWSPARRRAFRGRPRVLVVSPYLPFPLTHGGAVRIWNLCRALSDRVDFVLACFREANEVGDYERLHQVFREVYIVDQDEKASDSSVPKQVTEYRNPAMAGLIRSLCLEHRVDLVQLEYTQLAEYRDETGAIPVILVEHDITFTLYRQLSECGGGAEAKNEYLRWLDFEREALQCSNMVWTMSDEDRALTLEHGSSHDRARVIRNGVDLCRFKPAPEPCGPPVVLFVGSLRHLPNLLALEALRESIMPAVWREMPEAILHVVAGPGSERAAELAGKAKLLEMDPRIDIEGFVEDVGPAYRGATLVAVPLPVSAGTNIKVMEAMACGRAIVSTPAGCRGLELESGRELVIAGLDDFAAAVIALLRNEDLRRRIAAEARRTAECRFGWESIAEEAFRCYAALIDQPSILAARV